MTEDDITLPSGRIVNANNGYVGINADLEVCDGYDSAHRAASPTYEDPFGDEYSAPWEKRDALALADRMIALWQQYRSAWEAK